jgi:hypothetical protein
MSIERTTAIEDKSRHAEASFVLGVSENLDNIPEHKRRKYANAHVRGTDDARGDKESPKDCSCLKSYEHFTRALAPRFIGRRRDFYIPKIPTNLGNIPSVNMYMNVFYIPWFAGLILYIYKPATTPNPDF